MTTKAEIEASINELEVLVALAERVVRSHAPTGLGLFYNRGQRLALNHLEAAVTRFRLMVRRAQKEHGWAAK